MEAIVKFEQMGRERAAFFEEATQIVRAAEAQSRTLTGEEDARVLELMTRVRKLEKQAGHMKRHGARNWSDKQMSRTHYLLELDSVRHNLIEMGETNAVLLSEALRAIVEPTPASLERASELEAQTDHQHRLIHDQCLNLITLQAPVARDARLVTGALDAIVDLELMGDYAYEIVTLSSSLRQKPPSQILIRISEIGAKIQGVLKIAIDNWRSGERDGAQSARPQEGAIRAECGALYEKLSQCTNGPGDSTSYVNLMLITRHLERILRHAVCVAEQAAAAAPLARRESGECSNV